MRAVSPSFNPHALLTLHRHLGPRPLPITHMATTRLEWCSALDRRKSRIRERREAISLSEGPSEGINSCVPWVHDFIFSVCGGKQDSFIDSFYPDWDRRLSDEESWVDPVVSEHAPRLYSPCVNCRTLWTWTESIEARGVKLRARIVRKERARRDPLVQQVVWFYGKSGIWPMVKISYLSVGWKQFGGCWECWECFHLLLSLSLSLTFGVSFSWINRF